MMCIDGPPDPGKNWPTGEKFDFSRKMADLLPNFPLIRLDCSENWLHMNSLPEKMPIKIKPKVDERGLVLTEDMSRSESRQCSRENRPIPEWSF